VLVKLVICWFLLHIPIVYNQFYRTGISFWSNLHIIIIFLYYSYMQCQINNNNNHHHHHLTITSQISNEIVSVVVYSCLSCAWFVLCFGAYFVCYGWYPLCNCFVMVFFMLIASIRMYFDYQYIWMMGWIKNENQNENACFILFITVHCINTCSIWSSSRKSTLIGMSGFTFISGLYEHKYKCPLHINKELRNIKLSSNSSSRLY
jgi:hypothetical protein